MSAAEKLKALDEVIRNGVPDESEPALWSLKPALPQIVAVVEAAEWKPNGRRAAHLRDARLNLALTALDKALS